MKPARRVLATSTLLMLMLATPAGQADELRSTLSQPMREVAHAVGVQIDEGVAKMVVRRSFAHRGKRHDEAVLEIGLPYGAAATGLRIRSATRWYRGELMEAEKARLLYRKLTGLGPHAPRDPALLRWVWANRLELFVFPVIPKLANTVEYTLTMPTSYVDGRYTVTYPKPDATSGKLAAVILRVAGQQARVDAQPLPPGQPVVLMGKAKKKVRVDARSVIAVKKAMEIVRLKVGVDIRHTYRGDLRVVLQSPGKKKWVLHDREGGDKNDVRLDKELKLEAPMAAKGQWRLIVDDNAGLDVGVLRRFSLQLWPKKVKRPRRFAGKDLPQTIPEHAGGDRVELAQVSVPAPKIRTVAARLGRVVAAPGKMFSRFELDVAHPLRPLPKKLTVVFVVDASHSMAKEGIASQLALARAFLSHVPDARFDVVVYRRFARRLAGKWVQAKGFDKLVDAARKKGDLRPANGSALDAGLKQAAGALASLRGPTMVISLGDTLLRPSWRNAQGRRWLRRMPRATSHVAVVQVEGDVLRERRDDDHPRAELASKHGGVLLRLSGLGLRDKSKDKLRRVALGLVRPIRIDHAKVVGLPDELEIPQTLEEGKGLREMAPVKGAPASVQIRGKIWAKSFRRRVVATARFSRHTAAFVFSHSQHDDLDNKQMLRVARQGRVVSPVTSYLAIEPGVRPSTAGLDLKGGGIGGGGFGSGGLGLSGRGGAGGLPSIRGALRILIKRCVAQHGAPTKAGQLVIDTTLDEIVDVNTPGLKGGLARCVGEGAWAFRLPTAYRGVSRKKVIEAVP